MRLVISQRAKQTGCRFRNPDRVTRHSGTDTSLEARARHIGAVGMRTFYVGLVFNLRNGLVVSALALFASGLISFSRL